ncbi:MAG: succinyl-diaminopimelate desuccinylase [Pseudomonadota bacterium]
MIPDPVALAKALIKEPSVTPATGAVFDVCEAALTAAGFAVTRLTFDTHGTPVENLFAIAGESGRHLTLAGHVDVVPPGPADAWHHGPFAAAEADGILYGRGAQDMKGAVAAMIAAGAAWRAGGGAGRLSYLITGDEEGPALDGTKPLAAWAAEHHPFDAAVVGEPTSRERFGDTIKVGRRGSLSAELTVTGRQGHVAYQEKADNPIPALLAIGAALNQPIDDGTDVFAPTNLEITSVDVANPAHNVIPGAGTLRFNVRFNDRWTVAALKEALAARIARAAPSATVELNWRAGHSDVFRTVDADLISRVSAAVRETTGITPECTTGGGTSDARFLKDYGPVVEFGAVGTTMHQVNEATPVDELVALTKTYEAIIARVLA